MDATIARVALPRRYEAEGVRRYGFHGLSYEYIAGRLAAISPALAAGRTVVAHLGNGASLCAMRGGRSLDTTMGFSALDGLVMGTRPGATDPGVLLYLLREKRMSPDALEHLLYRESGLLGVSGISADMRTLLASGEASAREALDLFAFRAARETAALAGTLGGLDGLVFTAGIGEHAAPVRAAICERLAWLGVALDAAANAAHAELISAPASRVEVRIIPTNEEIVIARHAWEVVSNRPTTRGAIGRYSRSRCLHRRRHAMIADDHARSAQGAVGAALGRHEHGSARLEVFRDGRGDGDDRGAGGNGDLLFLAVVIGDGQHRPVDAGDLVGDGAVGHRAVGLEVPRPGALAGAFHRGRERSALPALRRCRSAAGADAMPT